MKQILYDMGPQVVTFISGGKTLPPHMGKNKFVLHAFKTISVALNQCFLVKNLPILTPSPPLSGKFHYFFFETFPYYVRYYKLVSQIS